MGKGGREGTWELTQKDLSLTGLESAVLKSGDSETRVSKCCTLKPECLSAMPRPAIYKPSNFRKVT